MTNDILSLEGGTARITGGSSGIGPAAAKAFAAAGAAVAITGRNTDRLADARKEVGRSVKTFVADSASVADPDRLMVRVRDEIGSVDIPFANAGVGIFEPVVEIDEQTFDDVFDITVKGVFFTVHKALPILNDGASVGLTASTVAHLGAPGSTAYAASKMGVHGLARTLSAARRPPRRLRTSRFSLPPTHPTTMRGTEVLADGGVSRLNIAVPSDRST